MSELRAGILQAGNCVEGDALLFARLDRGEGTPQLASMAVKSCLGCSQLETCGQPERLAENTERLLGRALGSTVIAGTQAGMPEGVAIAPAPMRGADRHAKLEELAYRTETVEDRLDALRLALRTEVIKANSATLRDAEPLLARALSMVGDSQEGSQATADEKAMRKFMVAAVQFCRLAGLDCPAHELRDLCRLYLQDISAMQAASVNKPHAQRLAIYNGAAVVDSVRIAVTEEGLSGSVGNRILSMYPVDPVGKIRQIATQVGTFRSVTEPLLRQKYDFTGEITNNAVEVACMEMADPGKYFADRLAQLQRLRRAYPYMASHPRNKNGLFRMRDSVEVSKARADRAEQPPEVVTFDAESPRRGQGMLLKVLAKRRIGGIATEGTPSLDDYEMARQLLANKHVLGIEDDEVTVAYGTLVHCMVRLYNEGLPEGQQLDTSVRSIAELLTMYRRNVTEVSDIAPNQAEVIASLLPARHYEDLLDQYDEKTSFTVAQVHELILRNRSNVEGALATAADMVERLTQQYKGRLRPSFIRALMVMKNLDEAVITAAAEGAITTLADTEGHVRKLLPEVTDSFIRYFYTHTKNPERKSHEWARRVRIALDAYPDDHRVKMWVIGIVLRDHERGAGSGRRYTDQEIFDAVDGYLLRCDELAADAQRRKFKLADKMIMQWASHNSKTYHTSLDKFSASHEVILEELARHGVYDIYPEALHAIAFNIVDTTKIPSRIVKFLRIRSELADLVEGNRHVRSWMIDSSATILNLRWSKQRLRRLITLSRSGIFDRRNKELDDTRGAQGADTYDRHQHINPDKSTAEDAAVAQMSLDRIITSLPIHEAAAMRLIAGQETAFEEEEILEALGVTSLDEYVEDVLLPKIQIMLTKFPPSP